MKAIRERAHVSLGGVGPGWPRGVAGSESGVITGITATSITDTTKAWSTAPKRWVSWTTGATWNPVDYDLVIGDDYFGEPQTIIRVPITDNSADTLTVGDMTNWVTAGYVPSLASLVGATFTIIRRDGTYYPWWHQRWPQRPNDKKLAQGSVSSATTSSATVIGAGWTVNQFAGKAFFGFDSGGLIRKVTIASNTNDTLSWSAQSWTPSGAFEIQESTSSVCWPGITADPMLAWYRGYMDSVRTHFQNDASVAVKYPATNITYTLWNGVACASTSDPIFDVDFIVDYQDNCTDRDKHFAKDIFKTFRGWQMILETMASAFIEARTWDGEPYIENFRIATWLKKANINYLGTFTDTADGSGQADFSISGLPTPAPTYFYAILKNDSEQVVASGTSSASTLTITGLTASTTYRAVVSLGWTRKIPMMFRGLFDSTYFEPDDDGGLVDPPEETFPGTWVTIPKSTALLEYGTDGSIIESQAFINGDRARYVGDRWQDYGFAGNAGGTIADDLEPYWMKGARRRHPEAAETTLRAQLAGTVAGGGAGWLRTEDQDWYTDNWYAGGVLITHTGTASGGSTTALSDTSKSGSSFWDGTRGRWLGHSIEIEASPGAWEARLCTGYNAGTQTITVSPAWSSTASGKAYRIREPKYQLNRYIGRTVTLTENDGTTTHTATILGNSDNHLFFSGSTSPAAGWTFEIDDPIVGSVFNRTAGAWVINANPRRAEPDFITRYGRYSLNDYAGVHLQEELYKGINALRWIKIAFGWHNFDASMVEEDNEQQYTQFGIASEAEWDAVWPIAQMGYGATAPNPADNQGPLCYASGGIHFVDPAQGGATLRRSYAYGHATTTEIFTPEIDFYNFAEKLNPNPVAPNLSAFDANGDDVTENLFNLFETVTPTNGLAVTSQFGSLDEPNNPPTFPGQPSDPDSYFSHKGYVITDETAIARFDVAGGFTYVD